MNESDCHGKTHQKESSKIAQQMILGNRQQWSWLQSFVAL
jgi:hypothetical protein